MKRLIPIFILSLFLLSLEPAGAQVYEAPPVTVSTEKVRIGGETYYSHKVIEKQTLYSISKAYGVKTEDILKANPGIGPDGQLKAGSIILIPAGKKPAQVQDTVRITTPPAETVKTPADRFDGIDYYTHTVKWYENLQSIAKKYKVSEELLIEFNGLESIYVRKRQKLKIPEAGFIPQVEAIIAGSIGSETPKTPVPGQEEEILPTVPGGTYAEDAAVSISLILPLDCAMEGNGGNVNYMDFYSGALMAAKELNEKGFNLKITVIDTQEYNSAEDIAASGILDGCDYVIGPVHAREIEGILPYCLSKGISVVSPLDHKAESLAAGHSNLVQAPVSTEAQFESIAGWIKEEGGDVVLVLSEVGGTAGKERSEAETALSDAGIRFESFSYNILQGRGVETSIARYLDIEKANNIVIASENEAFVNDAVRNINTLCTIRKFNIRTYGTSKLKSFETIETEHFHNINLHLAMGYHVDYDMPETMKFVSGYRALFNTEPTPFAFQGYDTFMFFATAASMIKSGEYLGLDQIPRTRLIQSDMKFERVTDGSGLTGGYVNMAARRIIFRGNYEIFLVKD